MTIAARPHTFVLTEEIEEVEICYVELGTTKSGFGEDADNTVPEGIDLATVIEHVDREITLKLSCKSLPFTLLFYLAVMWSAWLKCDTFQYGVGSSVQELFGNIEVDPQDVKTLYPHRGGVTEKSRDKALGSARRLKAGSASDTKKDVNEVFSHSTLWTFLHQGVVPTLWYEGKGRVRSFHKIIGGVRLRQTRPANVACPSSNAALGAWYAPEQKCRAYAELSNEPFGVNRSSDIAFNPSDVPGYYEAWLPINQNQSEVQARLKDLWHSGWLDYNTQTVYLEVGLYNGDVDAFALGQYKYDFLSDGAVRFVPKTYTANNQYMKWYYFAADGMVGFLVLTLLLQETKEVCRAVSEQEFVAKYLTGTESMWNLADWMCTILGTVSLAGYVWLHQMREVVTDKLVETHSKNLGPSGWSATLDALLDLIVFKKTHELIIFAFLLAIMVRFFKAFRGQPRLAVLSATFAMCCQEVMYFFVIFVVIFSNFVVTGFLLFNSQIKEWSTLSKSINECFEILMGEFDFTEMYVVHPFAASLWFWAYMMLVLLITLSMLLAVILETYSVVKVELGGMNSEGLVTQIYHLLLQSRFHRYASGDWNSDSTGWHKIEKVRDDLLALEGAQRLTLMRDPRFIGQHVVFRVTQNTFKAISVPEQQIKFFWKVLKKHIEKGHDEEQEEDVLADVQAPPEQTEEPGEDMDELILKLEKRMASNENTLRLALRDVFAKVTDLDGRTNWGVKP